MHTIPPPTAYQCSVCPSRKVATHSSSSMTLFQDLLLAMSRDSNSLLMLLLWVSVAQRVILHGEEWGLNSGFPGTLLFMLKLFWMKLMISSRSGSLRCSSAQLSATRFAGLELSRVAMSGVITEVVVVMVATCGTSWLADSSAGEDCGQRERASALELGRYWIFTFLTPLAYTFVHHLACFPDGLGVWRMAFTAVWSVRTVTSCL